MTEPHSCNSCGCGETGISHTWLWTPGRIKGHGLGKIKAHGRGKDSL